MNKKYSMAMKDKTSPKSIILSIIAIALLTLTFANLVIASISIQEPSTNQLGLYTGGTEWVRLNGSGNLGIGTLNPSARLEVNGSVNISGTNPNIYIGNVAVCLANGTNCPEQPFQASGGTISYSNGYIIHTFTSSGTFTPTQSGIVEVLVVAGGGGGGSGQSGGGGGGGVLYNLSFNVSSQSYAVIVGSGGSGGPLNVNGSSGGNSSFGGMVAVGGGGGGGWTGNQNGQSGGSGGGAVDNSIVTTGGSGTSGQGNAGGSSSTTYADPYVGGGGGGCGAAGGTSKSQGGTSAGGIGCQYSISGSSTYYGGGGGGGGNINFANSPGAGGTGGGGAGSSTGAGTSGTANTGGGGGGGAYDGGAGGNGGSGVVIISYPLENAGSGLLFVNVSSQASTGYIPQMQSNTVLNNSVIYQSGSNIGVATTTPTSTLHVSGVTNTTYLTIATATAASCDLKAYTNGTVYCGTDSSGSDGTGGWTNTTTTTSTSLDVNVDSGTLYINSTSNKVGIGTTSPATNLDIQGNTTINQTLYADTIQITGACCGTAINFNNENMIGLNTITISDGGPSEGIQWADSTWSIDNSPLDRSNTAGNLNLYSTQYNISLWRPTLLIFNSGNYTTLIPQSGGGLDIITSGTGTGGHITFNQAGNIGIKTSSPTSTLQINGQTNTTYLTIASATAASCDLKAYTNGTVYCGTDVDTNSGGTVTGTGTGGYITQFQSASVINSSAIYQNGSKIGINITTPAEVLHVNGKIRADTAFVLNGATALSLPAANTLAIAESSGWSNGVVIYTNGTEKVRIDVNGSVGIGTSNPLSKLHITNAISTRDGSWQSALEIQPTGPASNFPSIYFSGQNSSAYSGIIWTNSTSGNSNTQVTGAIWTFPTNNTNADMYFATNNALGSASYSTKMVILGNGRVGIGTANPSGTLEVSGNVTATAYYYSSDERLKDNITTLTGLAIVDKLRGVSFDWKEDGSSSVGVIAQEVEKVLPEVVSTNSYNGMKSVNYGALVGPLIESAKELEHQNIKQEAELQQLRKELQELKSDLRRIQRQGGSI